MTILDWNVQRRMQGGTAYIKGCNSYKRMNININNVMFSSSRALKWYEKNIGDQLTCEMDGLRTTKNMNVNSFELTLLCLGVQVTGAPLPKLHRLYCRTDMSLNESHRASYL